MTNNFSLPTPSPKISIDCPQITMTKVTEVVDDSKVLICLYDIKSWMLCSAGANGSHQGHQPIGMTPNIWIEKNLRELLMASQTGTILILF
jgi:hypothetical protein